MKRLTLKQMRFVAGIWLVVFLFAIGNESLEWGILGSSAKLFRSIVMIIGLLALFRFGPKIFDEMESHTSAKRESEEAAERARDKSNDAEEADRLRRAIGMPADASREGAAQQSAAADPRENAAPTER
jgi:hypothetical protein